MGIMTNQNPPPPVIDFARVIAWAIVDAGVRWTGRQAVFVGEERLGPVPRLAICQNVNGPLTDFLLFHCNDSWEVLGVSGGTTIEDVRSMAERAYEGISAKWNEVNVAASEAEAWIRANRPEQVCGFCGKLPTEVDGMFNGESTAICFACVREMYCQLPPREKI